MILFLKAFTKKYVKYDTQQNPGQHYGARNSIMVSVNYTEIIILCGVSLYWMSLCSLSWCQVEYLKISRSAECRYTKCRYAQCRAAKLNT